MFVFVQFLQSVSKPGEQMIAELSVNFIILFELLMSSFLHKIVNAAWKIGWKAGTVRNALLVTDALRDIENYEALIHLKRATNKIR